MNVLASRGDIKPRRSGRVQVSVNSNQLSHNTTRRVACVSKFRNIKGNPPLALWRIIKLIPQVVFVSKTAQR